MNVRASALRVVLPAVAAAVLAACSKPVVAPPKPEPTVVTPTLAAAPRINIDARGRPTPVVLRVYLLKNASAFEGADFFSLFDREQQVLGDAVLAREEIVLKPGETRTLDARDAEGARVVGVLAAFREVDRAVWRATVPVVPNRGNLVTIRVEDDRISLAATLAPLPPPKKAD